MAFTMGYKVNANTQYEFTVSNETIQEVVLGGGITDGDIADYCYTALVDSRVKRLAPPLHSDTFQQGWPEWVQANCIGYMTNSGTMPNTAPAFNKDLLSDTDQVYQRDFLTWEGTIYPDTEQAKTGTFLVMDMKDIKRWYVDFNNAGFGTGTVTSSDFSQYQVAWPGYTGPVYIYQGNNYSRPTIMSDNNDPLLNPDHNLSVCNVLIVNDELWIGDLNPSTHGTSDIGGSNAPYTALSDLWRYGGYLNHGNTDPQRVYQKGTLDFGAVPDYGAVGDYPNCPNPNAGSLPYATFVECSNDGMIMECSGQFGQQNYSCSIWVTCRSYTKYLHTILDWQAWCGLKFTYDNVMYKPIIQNGVVVGHTSDMDEESEYDDMTNVTGNNIPSGPPKPPKPSPGQWDNIEGAGTFNGTLQFVRSYYMSSTELLNLKTWMGKKEADGGPPDGYDMLESIISIKMFPFALASGADDAVDITIPGSGSAWSKLIETNWIARVAAAIDNTIVPEDAPVQYRHINTGCMGHATNASGINYDLGTLNMSDFVNDQYPFFTYDAAVELYIPFVGTFTLDPQTVMGRTLHCYLNLDPATGGVYGYCLCNNNGNNVMIASGTGNIAVEVPISSAQAGVLQAQVDAIRSQQFAALISTAAALAMPVLGAGLSAMAAEQGISGAAVAMGLTSQADASLAVRSAGYNAALKSMGGQVSGELASVATNALTANRQVKNLTQSHNMAMTGSVGASTAEWGCPWDAYVKVMRPKVHNPGGNYNHAVAVPTYKSGKLSSYKGLTVCINPDASKIAKATPAERNAIVTMLQGGVIV